MCNHRLCLRFQTGSLSRTASTYCHPVSLQLPIGKKLPKGANVRSSVLPPALHRKKHPARPECAISCFLQPSTVKNIHLGLKLWSSAFLLGKSVFLLAPYWEKNLRTAPTFDHRFSPGSLLEKKLPHGANVRFLHHHFRLLITSKIRLGMFNTV